MKFPQYQKGSTGLIVVIVLLIILIAGGAFYLGKISNQLNISGQSSTLDQSSTITGSPVRSSENEVEWVRYSDDKYGFSVNYPKDWKYEFNIGLSESAVAENKVYSVTFTSPDEATWFQFRIYNGNGKWENFLALEAEQGNTNETIFAGQPALIVSLENSQQIIFVKYPKDENKIVLLSVMGKDINLSSEIAKSLKFN